MSLTLEYTGSELCSKCFEKEATHAEWVEFKNTLPLPPEVADIVGSMTGIWNGVCNDCCDPTTKHKVPNG